jgi:hypothetical protein
MPYAAYLRTPPRHPLISSTLRKNSHFWIGNLLVSKIESWMDTIYALIDDNPEKTRISHFCHAEASETSFGSATFQMPLWFLRLHRLHKRDVHDFGPWKSHGADTYSAQPPI